jgi:RNA-directed DNA polymerase
LLLPESLHRGFGKVKGNAEKPGIDGQTVEAFAQDVAGEIVMLVCELRDKIYRPKPVKRVEIPKDGGGVRELGIPTVRDRVVQQALLEILQPIFDPTFHPSSYGYRPGQSPHQAIAKAELFIRTHNLRHVADMDLSKCFDTLDHNLDTWRNPEAGNRLERAGSSEAVSPKRVYDRRRICGGGRGKPPG